MKSAPLDPAFFDLPITHRGLHKKGSVENSRAAFAAALAQGLPIELDLQASSDGRAVVFHDKHMKRLTGIDADTNSRTLAELTDINLSGSEDKIQSLNDLFDQVCGTVPLLIEIKDQSGQLGPECHNAFIENIAVNCRNYAGEIAIMSFNPYIIETLRPLLPRNPMGLVTDDFLHADWHFLPRDRAISLNAMAEIENQQIDFISHNWNDLPRVAHLDLPKFCWTVKSKADETTARQVADNITFEGYDPLAVS